MNPQERAREKIDETRARPFDTPAREHYYVRD
jgi:hypothetical protein